MQRIHAPYEAASEVDPAELRERLARYEIPRSFERVAQPPRDDAGKVQRSALRAARLAEADEH